MQAELHPKPAVKREQFRRDVLRGLHAEQKQLPSKYFYDQRGSQLFDRICELPEYYPTRTEVAIMRAHAAEMAERIGPHAMIIELGSGSSMKTGWLLKSLPRPTCYVPVDISGTHLREAAARIADDFPDIEVEPLHADFSSEFNLPQVATKVARRVVYFPGSTIGNFRPEAARTLLARMAHLAGAGGGLLVGYDLVKSREVLEKAYDDAAEVTAAFNKNLLRRINRELDANFMLSRFHHRAVYNAKHQRIEMHLVSTAEQVVAIGPQEVPFARGETIRTELSHKYTIDAFAEMATASGFAPGTVWTDANALFAVAYYPVAEHPPSACGT